MSLWIAFSSLLLVTLIVIVLPVIRNKYASSADHNALVYQDQLIEIDKDVKLGLLRTPEADALRTEINRRLDKPDYYLAEGMADQPPGENRQLGTAIAILIIIPLAALGLYNHIGSPNEPDLPFAQRKFDNPIKNSNSEMSRLVKALKERITKNIDKIDGWLLLGSTLATLERYSEASDAFKSAFKLDSSRADIAASAAETGFMAMKGKFTPEVRNYFKKALNLNPKEHKALYYFGLDLANQKKYADAVQNWVDLISISPVGAPWLDTVRLRLVEAATAGNLTITKFKPRIKIEKVPGPTKDDIKAAENMSNSDRQAFIRSMVFQLAERLKTEPDDLDGWRRLARAYTVLGETKKAAEANARIKVLEQ